MCTCVLPVCMYVCVPCAHLVSEEVRRESLGSSGFGVIDGCELLCRYWDLNPVLLEEAASVLNI